MLTTSRGRVALRALKLVAVLLALAYVARALAVHRAEAARVLAGTRPSWPALVASALVVLAAYVVLIQVWRALLAGGGQRLAFAPAARIWTVSNLGKYVPGKVWQMSAMAVMAREQGVSGVAAAGSAVLSTLVTLATGFAVTVLCGAQVFTDRRVALAALGAVVAALAMAPRALPVAERVLRRATGRDLTMPRLTPRTLAVAVVGSTVAWLLLGAGFHLLARGVGVASLPIAASVASFVGSYLLGFVAVFAPGGIGVREGVMHLALRQVGLGDGEALVLVVASRIWLTVLEVAPALAFLALGTRRPSRLAPHDAERAPRRT